MRHNPEYLRARSLMIDLDNKKVNRTIFMRRFRGVVQDRFPKIKWKTHWRKSPSGRGYHFWAIAVNSKCAFDPERIVLTQFMLGSDYRRENANLGRIKAGIKNWNILFATKRLPLYRK